MKSNPSLLIRLIILGLAISAGILTIIASGPNMMWVKPGATQQEFNTDKYECMKESQQRVSSSRVDAYGGSSSNKVITNQNLFNACMQARGWSLQQQQE